MIYLTKVLSIDIRDPFLSIAYLGRNHKGIDLIDSAVIKKNPIPVSSMKDGEENEYDESLLEDLRSFIEEKKISPEETVICIPRNVIMLQFVDLPSPDVASLPNILKYELDRLVPMNPEDIYYDFKIIGKKQENSFKVLLVAIPKKVAEYYVGLFKRVGLPPTAINVSTFASYNSAHFFHYDLSKPLALIDVSAKDFELIFVEDNNIRFSRSIKITNEEWGKCFFNGREFIKDDGKAIEELSEVILQNLNRSEGIVNERDNGRPMERILLTGGGQSDQVLLNYITQGSDLEVESVTPSKKSIEIKGDMDGTNSLASAIGLGLGELRKNPFKINLIPQSMRAKRKRSHIVLTFVLLGLIVLSFFGIIGSAILKDRLDLSKINAELKSIKKQVMKVEEMQLHNETFRTQLLELNRHWEKDINVMAVIKELTGIIPNNIWLSNLIIKGNAVEIRGNATSASTLIPILDKSPLLKDVRFEGSIKKRKGVEKFKIKMVIE